MGVIATTVRHLMAAGITGEALVAAIEEIEAELAVTISDIAGDESNANNALRDDPRRAEKLALNAERQRRFREARRASDNALRNDVTRDSVTSPALSLPPNDINSNPPTHTHPNRETPRARKGHRLPSDWEPQSLTGELTKSIDSWPPGAIERELARFRDWAASATGQTALKSDWQAAWRNWLRRCEDDGKYGRIQGGPPGNLRVVSGREVGRTEAAARDLLADLAVRRGP